jgi:non-ribosomal peptide synthetase component F
MEIRRRTGRAVFTVGTAASTRETAEDARVVGSGANMLPLAIRLETEDSFASLLVTAQRVLAGALQHARYPFARIYQEFRAQRSLPRHPTRYPLFDFAVTSMSTARQPRIWC